MWAAYNWLTKRFVSGWCEYGYEPLGSIKAGEYREWLIISTYEKKDSDAWSELFGKRVEVHTKVRILKIDWAILGFSARTLLPGVT
jgi:hypothetical protein